MIKRLFIKLPLYILTFLCTITLIVPLVYWIITGKDFTELFDDIDDI